MASAPPSNKPAVPPAPRRETCLGWLSAAALPAWSQRAVVGPDGSPAPQRYNECGETLVASVVAAVWGVGVSPDSFRAAVHGPSGGALTTANDLVAMLAYGNVLGTAHSGNAGELRAAIETATRDDRGVLLLGTWPTPGNALHWLLATGSALGRLDYLNPWGGVRSWLLWPDVASLFASSWVELAAHYHVDCSRRPMPW